MSSRFADHIPGRWSSHPAALKRQRIWLFLAGLAPLLVLAVVGVVALSDFDAIKRIASNPSLSVKVAVTAFALSLGAVLTLTMLNVVGRTLARRGGPAGRDELPFPLWLMVLGAFFWLVPLALTQIRTSIDPAYIGMLQFLLNLLCFVPFVSLLLWLWLARGGDEIPAGARRSKLLFLLGTIILSLAILSLFTDIHAMVNSVTWPGFAPVKELLNTVKPALLRMLLFAALFPLAVLCFALWQLVWMVPRAKKATREAGGESEEQAQAGDTPEDEPPAWLTALCDNLPQGARIGEGEPERVAVADTSPVMANGGVEVAVLMGGKVPTRDQYEFMERFKNAYRDALDAALENGDPRPVPARADILLQGNPGSGRTDVLCAAALYAALVRGQYVLFVVPDNEQAQIIQSRLDGRLEEMMLGCYVTSGVLSKTVADDWMAERPTGRIPNVLVATPERIESCFFANNTTIERKKLWRLRAAMLRYEVVLVDDFLDMDVTGRSHLAFIIDKLRLLLVSEYILPQFVVAVPRLHTPEGVEHLGARLFGQLNFDRTRNVLRLRPRPCEPFWSLTVRVADSARIETVCEELACQCLERKLSVLLYRKGIGESMRHDIEKDIRSHVEGGTLRVLSRLDGFTGEADSPDAVFYLSVACGNAGAALRLAMGNEQSVYIRVAGEAEADEQGDGDVVALLPDESAVPLRVMHLRSVLSFIDPMTPVEATVWSHFGISLTHPRLREATFGKRMFQYVHLTWLHDEWVEEDLYPASQIWAYLVLERAASVNTRGQQVNLRVLPNTRDAIYKVHGQKPNDPSRLLLARSGEGDDASLAKQLALWKDERGNAIGEMDVAHADTLKLAANGDVFVAASLRPPAQAEAERYAMSITPQYWRGNGGDYDIPLRHFAWQVSMVYRADAVWELGGLAGFELARPDGDFCRVEATLDGSLNLCGEERANTPRAYSYQAYLSGIFLGQTLPDGDEAPGAVRACLNGKWRTDAAAGFSPVLTHAVTATLRRRLDGWSFFALAPAFYIGGRERSVGAVVIWLLEPVNSGCTAYPLLRKLLENQAFKSGFLRDVRAEVEKGLSIAKLRLASRVAFKSETADERDIAASRKLLDSIIHGGPIGETRAREENGGTPPPGRIYKEHYSQEEREFDQAIVTGLMAFEESIDVTKFAAKYGWDEKRIAETFNDVLWNNPQVFYVSRRGKFWFWSDSTTGQITRFIITDLLYGIERGEYAVRKAELEREAAEAMKVVQSATDPAEKARRLHDHLVTVCEYDEDAAAADDSSPLARTVYGALVRGRAVCEGYTMAYRYLLSLAGVQSEEIRSEAMNHCWNYVKVGDDWYHVDVTHDDPVYIGGRHDRQAIAHTYFLLSDDAIRSKEHYGWDTRGLPPATNTHYDGRRWDDSLRATTGQTI